MVWTGIYCGYTVGNCHFPESVNTKTLFPTVQPQYTCPNHPNSVLLSPNLGSEPEQYICTVCVFYENLGLFIFDLNKKGAIVV